MPFQRVCIKVIKLLKRKSHTWQRNLLKWKDERKPNAYHTKRCVHVCVHYIYILLFRYPFRAPPPTYVYWSQDWEKHWCFSPPDMEHIFEHFIVLGLWQSRRFSVMGNNQKGLGSVFYCGMITPWWEAWPAHRDTEAYSVLMFVQQKRFMK